MPTIYKPAAHLATPSAPIAYGTVFGKLTVLRSFKDKRGKLRYECGCVCGTKKNVVRGNDLLKGRVLACRRCTGKRR